MTHEPNRKNALEWTVFCASALLVAATIGLLAWQALRFGDEPADLRVAIDSVSSRGGSTRVVLRVHNLGGASAKAVQVEAAHRDGQTSTLAFDFIARGGSAKGAAIFNGTVVEKDLTLRVTGYEE